MSQNAYGVLGQYSTCCYYNWSGPPALLVVKDFIFSSSINISFVGGPLLTFSQLTFPLVKAISCFQHHKTSKNWLSPDGDSWTSLLHRHHGYCWNFFLVPHHPGWFLFLAKSFFLLPESPQKSAFLPFPNFIIGSLGAWE